MTLQNKSSVVLAYNILHSGNIKFREKYLRPQYKFQSIYICQDLGHGEKVSYEEI